MKQFILLLSFVFILTLLVSCGASNSTKKGADSSSQNALAGSCGCNSAYSPVCDTNNKTYDNVCIANCFKAPQPVPGNCYCQNNLPVCARSKYTGSLKTLTECDAVLAFEEFGRYSIVSFSKCP